MPLYNPPPEMVRKTQGNARKGGRAIYIFVLEYKQVNVQPPNEAVMKYI